ncbi:hypothetical protein [Halobacillus sp. A5]|uniref:hypothetical protein n=1 Tax=Halobacillus sp. A5 TaxID=2880263 RepID=UPI0020A66A14|nr:hypothetical protein [Halobacillus sp. A5]MCP3027174.1 hypothetical protein [Halobacillus sp. A5]
MIWTVKTMLLGLSIMLAALLLQGEGVLNGFLVLFIGLIGLIITVVAFFSEGRTNKA